MTYFEFLNNIIYNYSVSNLIDIIKIEHDEEEGIFRVVSYEATRALIIVSEYKTTPDVDMPDIQGISQMGYLKSILNITSAGEKSSVKFKKTSDGVATETTFIVDSGTFKVKNVAKSLLPTTPKKLSAYNADISLDLDSEVISKILKILSLPMKNADIFLEASKNNKLLITMTNSVDSNYYELDLDLGDSVLDEPFKLNLDKFKEILKISMETGCELALSTAQKLCRIKKEDGIATYNYFLVRVG